jgi:hypothetical protein
MIDGFLIRNRTKKPVAIVLSGTGRRLRKRVGGSDLISVQNKLFGIVTMNPLCIYYTIF